MEGIYLMMLINGVYGIVLVAVLAGQGEESLMAVDRETAL